MQEDDEYECASVLHSHSQDVKKVVWHPTEEVSNVFIVSSSTEGCCHWRWGREAVIAVLDPCYSMLVQISQIFLSSL